MVYLIIAQDEALQRDMEEYTDLAQQVQTEENEAELVPVPTLTPDATTEPLSIGPKPVLSTDTPENAAPTAQQEIMPEGAVPTAQPGIVPESIATGSENITIIVIPGATDDPVCRDAAQIDAGQPLSPSPQVHVEEQPGKSEETGQHPDKREATTSPSPTANNLSSTVIPASTIDADSRSPTPAISSEPTPAPTPRIGKTGVDLDACKAQNDDFVAWLKIPGTKINYPVVWTDRVDYYLKHTFSGKESKIGTLFSLRKTDYESPGRNIAIYGHHITTSGGNMFQPLMSYKKQSFWESHKTIYLDTLYHLGEYTVFAVINMRNGEWDPAAASFGSGQAFLAFVRRAKAQALYETGVEVHADDHIITLITCDRDYHNPDGRLIVMAVEQ